MLYFFAKILLFLFTPNKLGNISANFLIFAYHKT